MPQSKSRRKVKSSATAAPRAVILGVPRWQFLFLAACCLVLIAAAWAWWSWDRANAAFEAIAAQGQAAMGKVETFPSEGGDHVAQGTAVRYRTDPPTSGAHYPTPSDPGLYEMPQLSGNLVHALQHGNIVIYYDRPAQDVMQTLKDWAHHFTNPWAGVVVTPQPGLGQEIVLTAWMKMLRLKIFDESAAAAFIDRYRGRGPENRVR